MDRITFCLLADYHIHQRILFDFRFPTVFELVGAVVASCLLGLVSPVAGSAGEIAPPVPATHDFSVLQSLADKPHKLPDGTYYVPSTPETILWGYCPNRDAKPVLTIPSGSTITFDTLSCEGMLEEQGRNPLKFFSRYGVKAAEVLTDAVTICKSQLKHDPTVSGPHIVTGPVAIEGAEPGDTLKIEMLSFVPRVPYGLVTTQHDLGVLPEFPETPAPQSDASVEHPERYNCAFTFLPLSKANGRIFASLNTLDKRQVRIPFAPFPGLIGVAANTSDSVNSVPPSKFGGNMDLNELTAGSILYLPVLVPQAKFFTGDPHMAQGDGEVALTAIEGSLRETFRITLLKRNDPSNPSGQMPFVETPTHWITVGFGANLDDALKDATRAAIAFLVERMHMDRTTAYAYLSTSGNFEITQAVDRTKGVHCEIRKSDFEFK